MLRLEAVEKQYVRRCQRITALQCPELSIAAGEYLAIVGPSGSGKTTLLSLLGGMLSPTSGQVWLNGQSLYQLPVAERSALRGRLMGFVFQSFQLIPYLTALENVQIPLSLLGVSPAEQSTRAASLLTRFGLAERLQHRPAELSIGQQQRVALARTLVNDPQLILADEPTGNLDPDSRKLVLDALDAAHAAGRTVVLVTHDPVAAARAKRQLTLRDGMLTPGAAYSLEERSAA